MGDQALPFKIHPEHFVFAGVHGGQEVMELIGEYGQPTYQKIFISLDAEKPVVPDADTKISIAGDTVWYASVQDEKRWTPHQIRSLFPRSNRRRDGTRSPRTPSS